MFSWNGVKGISCNSREISTSTNIWVLSNSSGHGNTACNLLRQSKTEEKKTLHYPRDVWPNQRSFIMNMCFLSALAGSGGRWREFRGRDCTSTHVPDTHSVRKQGIREGWGKGIKTTSGQLQRGVGRLRKGVSPLLIGNYPRQTLSFLSNRVGTLNNALNLFNTFLVD